MVAVTGDAVAHSREADFEQDRGLYGSHQRKRRKGAWTVRSPLVLMEAGRSEDGRRALRKVVPFAAASVICVLAVLAAVPGARGDSSASTIPLPVPGGSDYMASSEGKSKSLLSTLETLFKKNCELLNKLRVELNDFSDGLESLRELADSKLKGAFATGDPKSTTSASTADSTAESTALREMSVSDAQGSEEPDKTPSPNDPLFDRMGLRTSNTNSAGVRGDLPTPLQMKHIRRTYSLDDIVLTEEDAQDTKPLDEVVCFLDLDKCTIYGQDGNDLAIAMQWMGRPERQVVELYRRLMNPQIKPLVKQLHRAVKKTPVVLYTMRPQLLQYRSAARNSRVNLRWKSEWHHSPDQVVIPPTVTTPEQVLNEYSGLTPLLDGEKQDLFMSFQRLLCIRQVVEEELELDYKPYVVVTSTMKDVQTTAQKLGLRADLAYLWDDNQVLEGQPHVLTVEPYVAMDDKCRVRLLEFLQAELPAQELREEVVDFMLGAKPEHRCVQLTADGSGVEYHINEAIEIPRFPIPELPVCYSRPRFTGADGADESQQQASLREHFKSNIVEFWSAAWRKMDSDQLAARQQWKERLEMVW